MPIQRGQSGLCKMGTGCYSWRGLGIGWPAVKKKVHRVFGYLALRVICSPVGIEFEVSE